MSTDFNKTFSNTKQTIKQVIVKGRVITKKSTGKSISWIVKVDTIYDINGLIIKKGVQKKIVVTDPRVNGNITSGDTVMIKGVPESFRKATNPGEFDYLRYQRYNGFCGQFFNGEIYFLKKNNFNIIGIIEGLKEKGVTLFSSNLSFEASSLVLALFTGNKKYLSKERLEKIRVLGLSHLLAISGLHFGLILMFMQKILNICKIPQRLQSLFLIPVSWIILIFVGFQVSALRVCIFLTLLYPGKFLQKNIDSLNLLAVTTWIILSINPLTLFLISFQLSFIVYISILILIDPISHILEKVFFGSGLFLKIKSSLALSISAFSGSAPLLLFYYYELNLQGLLMNLWAVPMVGFILLLIFLSFLVTLFFPP